MDKEAVEAAVIRHSESVLKTAFLYMKNTSDAEDVAQDVFLELLKTQKKFNSDEHMKAWLIRVAINKSKDVLKSSWRLKRSEMSKDPVYLPSQEEDIVLEAMFQLEDKYRICLHLFYYEGYTIKEIAQIMCKKPSTIGSYLDRGRKKLKKMLEAEYEF